MGQTQDRYHSCVTSVPEAKQLLDVLYCLAACGLRCAVVTQTTSECCYRIQPLDVTSICTPRTQLLVETLRTPAWEELHPEATIPYMGHFMNFLF